MKHLNLFATMLAICICTSIGYSQTAKDIVQPGNLLLVNKDNIQSLRWSDIRSAVTAYQQAFGSIFQNDTLIVRVGKLKENEFGITHHNEIQLDMAHCQKLSSIQFKSVIWYLLSGTLEPKQVSLTDSFRLGSLETQVVVKTQGLRFIFKDGTECVLLQQAMAEAFGRAVDSNYIPMSVSRTYIGNLLNELVRKQWITGLDLVLGTQTNNPGIVIAKIVGVKEGMPLSRHDVRVVMGVFSRCYYTPDWQSFIPELQYYRDNREALYLLEP